MVLPSGRPRLRCRSPNTGLPVCTTVASVKLAVVNLPGRGRGVLGVPALGEGDDPSEVAPLRGSVASLLAPPSEDSWPLLGGGGRLGPRRSAHMLVPPFMRARAGCLRSGLSSRESHVLAGIGLKAGMILMLLSRFCNFW